MRERNAETTGRGAALIGHAIEWWRAMNAAPAKPQRSYAYSAGERAYYAHDDFNPYKEDTQSNEEWADGFEGARLCERSV